MEMERKKERDRRNRGDREKMSLPCGGLAGQRTEIKKV